MGRHSRKRSALEEGGRPTGTARPGPAAPPEPSDRYARARAKDAEVRAALRPLAPGQRPPIIAASAVIAVALGVHKDALYAAGVRVAGGTFAGTVGVGLVLLVAGIGMWRAQYWAVLGFETLLGVTTVFAALSLLVASNLAGAIRSTAVLLAAGFLFYKLIRAMARIQMPRRGT